MWPSVIIPSSFKYVFHVNTLVSQALNIFRVLVSIVKIIDLYTEVTLNVAFFPEKGRKNMLAKILFLQGSL